MGGKDVLKTTHVGEIRKLVRRQVGTINTKFELNLAVKEEKLEKGFQMIADAPETIIYDPNEIKDVFNNPRFFDQAGVSTIANLIKILIAHETGHLIDYKRNSFLFYNKGHEEQMELNAWKLGEQYIDDEIRSEYETFKDFSLDSYRRSNKFKQ
jgi:hypothetical protein